MSEPVNKTVLKNVLAEFMQSIEDWQSEIEGSPTKEDFAELSAIYDETIDSLDKEYFK